MPEIEDPVTYDPIIPYFRKWVILKEQVEEATRELNQLRDYCISSIEERGFRDHRGSQYIEMPFPIGSKEFTKIKRERRVTTKVDEEVAELITRAKGVYEKCFAMVPTLDAEELYVQYQLGVLTQEDMDMIFTQVESFSFRPTT